MNRIARRMKTMAEENVLPDGYIGNQKPNDIPAGQPGYKPDYETIDEKSQEEIKQYPAGAVGTYLKTIVTIIVCSLSITFIFTISSLGSLVTILSQSCLIAVIISSVKGSNNRSHTMLPNCGDIKRSPLRV